MIITYNALERYVSAFGAALYATASLVRIPAFSGPRARYALLKNWDLHILASHHVTGSWRT